MVYCAKRFSNLLNIVTCKQAANNVSEQVKKLLNEGMDVNVTAWGPKSKGVTPLHLAAEGGHVGVMDELLERGANIDARTKGACGCKIFCFSHRFQY